LVAPAAMSQKSRKSRTATDSAKSANQTALMSDSPAKAESEFSPSPWPPEDVDAGPVQAPPEGTCPTSSILEATSRHVVDLAANLEKFTATELVQTANARKDGTWTRVDASTFSYLAIVTRARKGHITVDESREGRGISTLPPLRAAGLAATALIFHPQMIDDFTMVCEGMGELDGKPLWMMHFAQKPDVPPHFQSIRVNNKLYDVKLKGRAWIAPDNFEIEHIDTDLLEPIPQIHLFTEHLSIEYGPVRFKTGNLRIWLPQRAEFYLDVGGRRFFHQHQLSNFLVFAVDTQQETKTPQLPK
jgi:hypothetical protein